MIQELIMMMSVFNSENVSGIFGKGGFNETFYFSLISSSGDFFINSCDIAVNGEC